MTLLVFNSILNERLQQYFDKYNIIHKAQIGFQPKTRTSEHVFVLKTLIDKYVGKGSKPFAFLLTLLKRLTLLCILYYLTL